MSCLLLRSQKLLWLLALLFAIAPHRLATAQEAATGSAQVARAVGTIKSVATNSLIVTPDSGAEVTATLTSTTKILRAPPGAKDLKNATSLTAQDLQAGDRVLVRGQAAPDGHS